MKQHVFRWGVGNKFRSVNANRFSPVHFERPKEVTVRSDYFESPSKHMRFDKLNEQWEVLWYEHHKLNGKPFPVKKFGVEESKQQAVEFMESLKTEGRLGEQLASFESENGVIWDARMQAWFSHNKSYSANKHGALKAKKLAENSASSSELVQLRARLLKLL